MLRGYVKVIIIQSGREIIKVSITDRDVRTLCIVPIERET
jgi:hypothetical protein